MTRLSPERVNQELTKTMQQVARPSRAIRLWKESGALAVLVPALATISPLLLDALDYLPKPGLHGRPQRLLNRLALLFLELEPTVAAASLRALRFSNDEVRWISELVSRWRLLGGEIERCVREGNRPSDVQLRQWAAAAGRTRFAPLLRVGAAIWAAKCEAGLMREQARAVGRLYRRAIRVAYRDPIEVADLAIDGEDLRREGVPPGPKIGRMLRALLGRVLIDPSLNTRDKLLEIVRHMLSTPEGDQPPDAGDSPTSRR